MKKILSTLVLTVAFLVMGTTGSLAVTLSPSDGNFPVSDNKTISILSTASSTAIQLRLTVNNAKIVSYSAPGGSALAIGVCDSAGASFRSVSASKYELCIDLASTGSGFTNGASLGTLTVASLNSSGGSFTIEGSEDNGYITSTGSLEATTSVLGNYVFGAGTGRVTVLPNTAISDYMPSKGLLGAAILLSGVVSLAVAIKIFLIDKRQEVF